jgi:hypothetical protein
MRVPAEHRPLRDGPGRRSPLRDREQRRAHRGRLPGRGQMRRLPRRRTFAFAVSAVCLAGSRSNGERSSRQRSLAPPSATKASLRRDLQVAVTSGRAVANCALHNATSSWVVWSPNSPAGAKPGARLLLDASQDHGGLVAASPQVRERGCRHRVAAQPFAARAEPFSSAARASGRLDSGVDPDSGPSAAIGSLQSYLFTAAA